MGLPATETPSSSLPLLWAGVRRRDRQSLTELYRLLYGELMRAGLMANGDAAATKDAINQVFLEIWERADQLVPVENVRSYLITYLRRKLLRDYERGIRHTDLSDEEAFAERSYEEIIVSQQQDEHLRLRLQAAIGQLTPRQKELVELRFFQGLSNEAISQQTGMHINTVYNTLSAALKTLRQALSAHRPHTLPVWWPLLLSGLTLPALLKIFAHEA